MGKSQRIKGLSKYRRWTKEEDILLKNLYANTFNKELAKIFNRRSQKVCRRAMKLGLKKNSKFISTSISNRQKQYFLKNVGCRIGEKNSNWKGGKRKLGENGYILIKLYNHPMVFKDNYYLYHRYVVENYIGRYLKPEEVIHHIDGKRDNNDIKNLYIFSSNSEHISFHSNVRYKNIKNNLKSNLSQYVS